MRKKLISDTSDTPFCAAGQSPIPMQIDLRVQKTLQEFLLSSLQITPHSILNNP